MSWAGAPRTRRVRAKAVRLSNSSSSSSKDRRSKPRAVPSKLPEGSSSCNISSCSCNASSSSSNNSYRFVLLFFRIARANKNFPWRAHLVSYPFLLSFIFL